MQSFKLFPSSRVMGTFFFLFLLVVSLLSCVEVEARNDGPIDQPEASRMLLKILSVKEFRLLLLPIQASLSLFFPLHPQ
jgi:hypothetical protein